MSFLKSKLTSLVLTITLIVLICTQSNTHNGDNERHRCGEEKRTIMALKELLLHTEERATRAERMLYEYISGNSDPNHQDNIYETIACEHTNSYISCNENQVIEVTYANYGRKNNITCPHSSIKSLNCLSSNSMEIVNSKCNGVRSCSVLASNSLFGDPCVYTFKYLQVNYKCNQAA